jgi:hypothetical protein
MILDGSMMNTYAAETVELEQEAETMVWEQNDERIKRAYRSHGQRHASFSQCVRRKHAKLHRDLCAEETKNAFEQTATSEG